MEKNLPIYPWFYFYCSQYLANISTLCEKKKKRKKGEEKERKRIYVSCPHGVLT